MLVRWKDRYGKEQQSAVPDAVAEIIELIGEDACAALLIALGGANVVFSERRTSEDSLIARAIGVEAALTLGTRFCAGNRARIPVANKFLARHLHTKGHGIAQIARTLRCADVTVQRYLTLERMITSDVLEENAMRLQSSAKRMRAIEHRKPSK